MTAITIQKVAQLAGVSVATVSRVLNDTGPVAEKTRQKVLQAAKELNYSPNLLGRNLRCRETKVILVMLSSLANTFLSKVIRGIEKQANQKGYHIMVCVTNASEQKEQSYINYVRRKFADGMIVLNSTLSQRQMEELSSSIPVVQCCEYASQATPFVSIDNRMAAFEATEYLIECGCKRIAYLGAEGCLISSLLRFEGYRQALEKHGIPFHSSLVLQGNYGYRNALEVTDTFLQREPNIDGLFAISDRMAAGAITALKLHNLRVPEDVKVIGFDNTDITYIYEPSISTVAQPQEELGTCAFHLLFQVLKQQPWQNTVLPHKLIIRNSTIKERKTC